MLKLRDYQTNAVAKLYAEWRDARNALLVSPMGSGKTVTVSHVVNDFNGPAIVMAHRQELVGQLSTTLARYDVPHRLIGPDAVVRNVVRMHVKACGMSYIHPNAHVGVAGVQTLLRRTNKLARWLDSVRLWVQDEAHHVLAGNSFGSCVDLFPHALGLGVTATPERADGKGLGRHADGVFDRMVLGPTMRELIDRGYLTEYRIFAPPSDMDVSRVNITSGGDYNGKQLKAAAQQSHIVGDVVQHYLRLARGKQGLTFATDVETATGIAQAYREGGVPAEVVTAKTPDLVRFDLMRALERRELLQLVNVDLFGEGTDIPAVEVVSMARPTQSFALFCQQFGRPLRLSDGKDRALIIDHVGNTLRHGLPDAARNWTLDARERRSQTSDAGVPPKGCPECTRVYERYLKGCPYCGHVPEPAARSAPKFVDGDLLELDPAVLAEMRKAVADVDGPPRLPTSAGPAAVGGARKQHRLRQEAQQELRASIAQWAGYQRAAGRDDSYSYRKFFHAFGVDVLTAQTLGRSQAEALRRQIDERMGQ